MHDVDGTELLEARCPALRTRPRHITGEWKAAFASTDAFAPLRSASVANLQRVAPADFLAGLASRSYVATLDEDERRRVLAEVEELLARSDAPLQAGNVVVPMRTDLFWTRLR